MHYAYYNFLFILQMIQMAIYSLDTLTSMFSLNYRGQLRLTEGDVMRVNTNFHESRRISVVVNIEFGYKFEILTTSRVLKL